MLLLTKGLIRCSKGNLIFKPMDSPFCSKAPRFPPSMIHGPPPVTTPKPFLASISPNFLASSYQRFPSGKRAEPKKVTVFLKSAKNCQPSTNSDIMRNTLQWKEERKSVGCLLTSIGNLEAGKL